MKKLIIEAFLSFVLVYVIIIIVMFFGQRSFIYFPQDAIEDKIVETIHPSLQTIHVLTEDHINLKAYLIPPMNQSKPILLVFHGNASLAPYMVNPLKPIIQNGYGILFAEYRGYGGNAGKPTEEGLYKDADAYVNYLYLQYPKHKIIAYGQSLGGAIAVDSVSRHPQKFSGLILEAPFDSALSVANKTYFFIPFKNLLLKDKYESDKKIGHIQLPKLFLIAGQDDVVGRDTGQRLYDLAITPKTIHIYDDAKHNNIFQYAAIKDVLLFLSDYK